MNIEAFAASRAERLRQADDEIRPIVAAALESRDWSSVVEAASVLWLEIFEREAPNAATTRGLTRFQAQLRESLRKTSQEPNVETVVMFVGTMTVNDATWAAGSNRATDAVKTWITRGDTDVRETHRAVDGQSVPAGETFDVGGSKLRYPGDPVGDPANWIYCRCLLAVGRKETAMADKTTTLTNARLFAASLVRPDGLPPGSDFGMVVDFPQPVDDPVEKVQTEPDPQQVEDDIEVDDDIEDPVDIPFYAVLAPEGVPTGDGRMFQKGALTHRDLPLPIQWQEFSADGHGGSPVVANITRAEKGEDGLYRAWGVIPPSKWQDEVVDAIVNGRIRGLSIDADMMELDFDASVEAIDDMYGGTMIFKAARIAGATLVAIPAFQEAFIAIGDDFPAEAAEECEECQDVADLVASADVKQDAAIIVGMLSAEDAAFHASSEIYPHLTMVYMDGAQNLGVDGMVSSIMEISEVAASVPGPITVDVTGRQELGDNGADVVMVDPGALRSIRDALLEKPTLRAAHEAVEQYPEWVAHVTVGYPDAPAVEDYAGEHIEIIGLAVMQGDDIAEFPFGEPATVIEPPEVALIAAAFEVKPGLKKDGTPPVCEYCDQTATQYVLHAEGMAHIPACDAHIEQAKDAAAKSTPGGEPDPGNINRVGSYGAAFAPGTKDGPGWITNPEDTARLRRYWVRGKGAAKIRWGAPGDFNRCRKQLAKYIKNPSYLAGTCANMHKEALGVWPGQENGRHALVAAGGTPAPILTLVAAAGSKVMPSSWFEDPKLDGPTPITITDDGRVYGHIAVWGTCHIGYPGMCQEPPKSKTDYALFHLGAVLTDSGEVAVGQITLGTGHASGRASAAAAAAHYDNTGSVVADVHVGEDGWGIWFAGSLRAGLSADRVAEFRAAKISGDWRSYRGNLEMVGALGVNVPGFPVPRASLAASGAQQLSLVAAGIVEHEPEVDPVADIEFSMDRIAELTADKLEARARVRRISETVAPIRGKMRIQKLAGIRSQFGTRGEPDGEADRTP